MPLKKLEDIKFSTVRRLNLSPKKTLRRCLTSFRLLNGGLGLGLIFFLLVLISLAQAPGNLSIRAADQNQEDALAERKILEEQLTELENQISEYQTTIDQYRKQGDTLKNEISLMETAVKKINLQIQAININLERLNQEIRDTQGQINQTENKIDLQKQSLAEFVRHLYEADSQSLIEILIANNRLSDFFNALNDNTLLQQKIKVTLDEVVNLRTLLLNQKEELSFQYNDVENLKYHQLIQKQQTQTIQKQKNQLLQETKGKESEYQKILTKTKESAAQIRSRIFQLLGGGALTFEEAYQYAKLAEGATGVRAAFILAVLNQESIFGKNVGQCFYNEKTRYAATAMNPSQIPVFLEILEKLKIDPGSTLTKVSCPNSDGSYGGAMGPAQFIPSTWKLYEKSISQITGNNPPSPWNNADAFAATALYLKEAINHSSCVNYAQQIPNQKQKLLERCAAARYYAGSRWYNYRLTYGEAVANKANDYQEDIEIIANQS